MEIFSMIIVNYPYFVAMVLFCIGIYAILSRANLMKKIIGINIMVNAIFLLLISSGNIRGGIAPIQSSTAEISAEQFYANPLPAALILTGIVVSLSVTSFALSVVVKINDYYGTIEANEIMEIRSRQ